MPQRPRSSSFYPVAAALTVATLCSVAAPAAAQEGSTALATDLRTAEAAFERGRPDYLLARDVLERAEAGSDLALRYRANLLQARLDSAGRRYSRAMPYYQRAQAYQLAARDAAATARLAAVQARLDSTAARLAERERELVQLRDELDSQASGARWGYLLIGGIALAVLAAGLAGFALVTGRLNSKLNAANERAGAEVAAAEAARTKLSGAGQAGAARLRRLLASASERLGESPAPGSAASQLAAQSAALKYLRQSSFEQGGLTEVAMEAFFERFNPELMALLNARSGATLDTDAMPVRLPLREAVAAGLAYTELVGNALRHGSGAVRATLTKEGHGVILTVTDEGGAQLADAQSGRGRRLVAGFAEDLSAKLDYPQPGSVRLRWETGSAKGAAAAI